MSDFVRMYLYDREGTPVPRTVALAPGAPRRVLYDTTAAAFGLPSNQIDIVVDRLTLPRSGFLTAADVKHLREEFVEVEKLPSASLGGRKPRRKAVSSTRRRRGRSLRVRARSGSRTRARSRRF